MAVNRMSSVPGSFAFTDTSVCWVDQSPSGKASAGLGMSLEIDDILTVTTDGEDDVNFRLHFAIHEKRSNKLLKGDSVIHCADPATRDGHVTKLRERLDEVTCRPKRVLVLINPNSGKKKGEKVFNGKVAPLFDLAGIEQKIVVTENAEKIHETIRDMDTETIDGIIAVGGDGTFLQVVNAVMNAAVTRDGGDASNPPESLPETAMRVGLIPVGSQCIITELMDGIIDLTTSALRVILGKKNRIDIGTVHHNEGSFLKYFALFFSYGCASDSLHDIAYKSQFSRLFSSSGKAAFNAFSANVKFLVNPDKSDDGEPAVATNGDVDASEIATSVFATKEVEGEFSNVAAFIPNLDSIFRQNALAEVDPAGLMSLVINSANVGAKSHRRFCKKFSKRNNSAFASNDVQRHQVAKVDVEAKEGQSGPSELVLDGEPVQLQAPASFTVKIHKGKINVFSK